MCCFSGPVSLVMNTSIFSRAADDGQQFIAYAMQIDAKMEVAMVLPLPVPPGSSEKALDFIDLSKYPGHLR